MPKEILVRYDKCLGCKSCEIACAVAHSKSQNLPGVVANEEKPLKRIFVHQVGGEKVPLNCRHCEEAPCIDACINGAMHRTSEGVITNEEGLHDCNGCWMCVMVCPYGVIRSFPDERRAIKCDRECFESKDEPACVRACPTGAIVYATVDTYGQKKRFGFLIEALT